MADTERRRPMIGAMFRGPGPAAYVLPGSTGYIGHDCTKYKKPAFSFGARTWKNQQLTGPGPKYKIEDVTRFGMEGTPKYTLHSRTNLQGKFQTPAPWDYKAEKKPVFKHAFPPQYSFGLRSPYGKQDNNPAPNNYNMPSIIGPKAVGKKSSAAFSMTSRSKIGSFHEDLQKTPGPGTYKVTDPNIYRNRKPIFSMTARNNAPGDRTLKPGPGAHRPELCYATFKRQPSFHFGQRWSEYVAPLIVDPID